jgi:Tfp pilus assembly protein PilN
MKAINLLPPDLRGTPKSASSKSKSAAVVDEPAGIGAFVVLGALAACVAALAVYVLTTNTVKDRQAQLEAVTAEAAATTKRVSQLKPYADFQQMAETRIQTVKDLASSRFDWEQALRDISRAVPADVTLTSLNGTIAGGAGTGGSPVRAAIAAPAIELKGCTRGQTQVATLLSRLRAVDGVTRVALSKSIKPAATAAVTPTPVTPGSPAAGCGATRAPQFELVMFFERSKVPATVEDITVQGATGSAPAATSGSAPSGTAQSNGGVTTPPADPATSGNSTPTSTSQGGGAR